MLRSGLSIALAALFLLIVQTMFALAEKRVALVIGNSAYTSVSALANPSNDADAISAALERLDFEVIKGVDLTNRQFLKKVREFTKAIRGADVALLFYAGHGLQVQGRNYLAPVDTQLLDESDLDFETIPLSMIMRQMEREERVNLVFLDACRDNPLARNLALSMGTRSASVGRGLAAVETGVGTLISYATQPGNVALDGAGTNSPFTEALLNHIETPGEDIAVLLRKVRRDVIEKTDGKQVPWGNSSLTGRVILKAKLEVNEPATSTASKLEEIFWDRIKDGDSAIYFETYLAQFPDGKFAPVAKLKLAEIEAADQARLSALEAERKAAEEAAREAERQRLAALEEERRKEAEAARLVAEEAERQREAERLAAEEAERLREAERLATLEAEREAQKQREAEAEAERQRLAKEAEARLAELEAARKAREEAEAARAQAVAEADAARKAFEERLAKLEAERKQQAENWKPAASDEPATTPEVEVAALAQPEDVPITSSEPQIDPKKDRELVRSIQQELNRVGCSAGKADGLWGRKTERAIQSFARNGKVQLASLDPSEDLLNSLKDKTSRVCPLTCRRGFEEKNGKCQRIPQTASLPAEQPKKPQPVTKPEPKQQTTKPKPEAPKKAKPGGKRPNALQYSYRLAPSARNSGGAGWGQKTFNTPYGKMRCVRGGGNRRCSWVK